MCAIFSEDEIKNYLPPYYTNNKQIRLNKNALEGTRMNGYSAIDYDLARYVLIDPLEHGFNTWKDKKLDKFIEEYGNECLDFKSITSEQFILSVAYEFLLQTGWNENEFYNYNKNKFGETIGGVDCSILATYYHADHGAQSTVMTICEKYIWAARNCICGFLCDRLPYGDEQAFISDYSLIDNFVIPMQEIKVIDPDNIPDDQPWYVPELSTVVIENSLDSKEAVFENIKNASSVNWQKWIQVKNDNALFPIKGSRLLALNLFSDFYSSSGIDTCLFANSIVVAKKDLQKFIEALQNKELFSRVCNPTDWDGYTESSCYITPKEVCWFPWKKHFESSNIDNFSELGLHSAVDRCCCNYPEYGDVYYSLPSALLRTILGIVDTDGYTFFDKDKNTISIYNIAGEKWRTAQNYLLVDEEQLMQSLKKQGLTIVWIMQELRQETGNAKEKLGDFYVERREFSIGFFKDDIFHTKKMISEFSSNAFNDKK